MLRKQFSTIIKYFFIQRNESFYPERFRISFPRLPVKYVGGVLSLLNLYTFYFLEVFYIIRVGPSVRQGQLALSVN